MSFETIIMAILGFCLVMTIVVGLHELGHYLAARKFGIVPAAFAIGFGPELTGYTDKHGTRWKINALPVGGYVRFPGPMHPAQYTDDQGERREMAQLPRYKRAIIVGAGPAINLILTLLILIGVGVSGRMAAMSTEVESLQQSSPLAEAGIKPGNRILSIDGKTNDGVLTYMILAQMSDNANQVFRVEKASGIQNINVRSVPQVNPTLRYGVEMVRKSAPSGIYDSTVTGLKISRDMLIIQAIAVRDIIFKKDSLNNINGPGTTAKISGEQLSNGVFTMVLLVALISNAIGFINLLPLPGLDGGHLAIYAVEAIKGKDIGPKTYATIQTLGLFTIAGMITVGLMNDISG